MSTRFPVRRTFLRLEEIRHEGGPEARDPQLKGAAMALVENPFAGRYEPDIESAMDELSPLGEQLASRLARALGGTDRVQGYGKGAVVGQDGELAATVLLAHLPADPTALLEPGDGVREPAARGQAPVGQLAHPHPPARRLGQRHEDLVVRVGDAGLVDELTVEPVEQQLRAVEPRAPRLLLLGVQPARL